MKKMFSRLFQRVISQKKQKSVQQRRLTERQRRLELELLEDRCMLAAASLDFATPNIFTYTPVSSGSIFFGLEKIDYLEFGKLHAGTDTNHNDIVSINKPLNQVSVFRHNQNTSNPGYGPAITTTITGLNAGGGEFALADMTGDGISDLIVLVPTPQTGGKMALTAKIYAGNANGTFSTTATTITFTDTFTTSGTAGSEMVILDYQLRDITGDKYPELIVMLQSKPLGGTGSTQYAAYYYQGRLGGFDTTHKVILPPSPTKTDSVAFANVLTSSSGLQLITETTRMSNNMAYQTLSFNTYNVSTNTTVAAGKYDYTAAASVHWTHYRNVDNDTADEIISGISYMDQGKLTYGVRVTHVESLASGTSSITVNPPQIHAVDIEPVYVTFGDMYRSGRLDILVSDGTSYQILRNTGTSFTKQAKVDTYANYIASAVGDFTGDGYQDVIVVGQTHVMFLPGNPSHPDYKTGKILETLPAKATAAVFGDFTGDGFIDIAICAGLAGETIYIYEGIKQTAQDPKFKQNHRYVVASPTTLLAGSFLGNPLRDDLAVVSGSTITVISLDITKPQRMTNFAGTITAAASGDLNGNGYDDIVVAHESNGTITIAMNNKDGTFNTQNQKSLGTGAKPVAVAIGDLNGDSRLDIAVVNTANSRIELLFQDTSGQFVNNPSGAPSYLQLPSTNAGARYNLQLADFDLDRRMDIIVGLSSTKQLMVYHQNGGRAGEFASTPSRFLLPANTLDGTLFSDLLGKTYWAMTTGYVPNGASGTPGVVVVSGNSIYRIQNTTKPESGLGTLEILVRDPAVVKNADANQYTTLSQLSSSSLTWLNEWGTYYIEIWGNSGETARISSFNCGITFDTNLFNVVTEDVVAGPHFTLSQPTVNVSGSTKTISLTGTTSQTRGNNQYALLARMLITPAINTAPANSKENVGVFMPAQKETGYPVSAICGIGFVNDVKINGKGVLTTKGINKMPVAPVVYDLDDSGRVNASDFIMFALAYGKKDVAGTEYAKYDFNQDGVVNASDFILFALAYGKSRQTGLANSLLPVISARASSLSVASEIVVPTTTVSTAAESATTESAITEFQSLTTDHGMEQNMELSSGPIAIVAGNSDYSGNNTLFDTAFDTIPVRTLAILELYGLTSRVERSVASWSDQERFDAVLEGLYIDRRYGEEDGGDDWWLVQSHVIDEPVLETILTDWVI